ncbi:hypothetical protein C8J56DRAFT_936204, partial [Mycena floridula]
MLAVATLHCFLLCLITASCFQPYAGSLAPAAPASGILANLAASWPAGLVLHSAANLSSLGCSGFFTSICSERYVVISNSVIPLPVIFSLVPV